jgi:hypothetical protein
VIGLTPPTAPRPPGSSPAQQPIGLPQLANDPLRRVPASRHLRAPLTHSLGSSKLSQRSDRTTGVRRPVPRRAAALAPVTALSLLATAPALERLHRKPRICRPRSVLRSQNIRPRRTQVESGFCCRRVVGKAHCNEGTPLSTVPSRLCVRMRHSNATSLPNPPQPLSILAVSAQQTERSDNHVERTGNGSSLLLARFHARRRSPSVLGPTPPLNGERPPGVTSVDRANRALDDSLSAPLVTLATNGVRPCAASCRDDRFSRRPGRSESTDFDHARRGQAGSRSIGRRRVRQRVCERERVHGPPASKDPGFGVRATTEPSPKTIQPNAADNTPANTTNPVAFTH